MPRKIPMTRVPYDQLPITAPRRTATRDTCTLLFWRVPRLLKDQFKTATHKRGTSMRGAILKFMEEYVHPPAKTK